MEVFCFLYIRRKIMDTLRMRHVGWILSICCLIFMLTACFAVETTPTIAVTAPGTTLLTLRSPSATNDMYAVAWSPDGKYIAYGGSDALVYVWDRQSHTLAFTARGHAGDIWSLAWSPDGKRLASD